MCVQRGIAQIPWLQRLSLSPGHFDSVRLESRQPWHGWVRVVCQRTCLVSALSKSIWHHNIATYPSSVAADYLKTMLTRYLPCAAANYLKKSTPNPRGPRGPSGACGKLEHGERISGSSVWVCFACGRPNDDATALSSPPWLHIVDGQ